MVKLSSVMEDAKSASDAHDWVAFGEAASDIGKLEKVAKPFMFLMPTTLKSGTGSIFKYASAFGKIQSAATTYAKLKYERGWSTTNSAGLAALQEGAKLLPILGDFYSAAIGIFVKLDGDFFWKTHHDRIQANLSREGGGSITR